MYTDFLELVRVSKINDLQALKQQPKGICTVTYYKSAHLTIPMRLHCEKKCFSMLIWYQMKDKSFIDVNKFK